MPLRAIAAASVCSTAALTGLIGRTQQGECTARVNTPGCPITIWLGNGIRRTCRTGRPYSCA